MIARYISKPVQIRERVNWLKVFAELVGHTRGLRRKTWRLAQDYWVIHRSGSFDRTFYLAQNPDVAAADCDPLWHYLCHGEPEGRRPSAVLTYPKLCDLMGAPSPLGDNLLAKLIREGPVVRESTNPVRTSNVVREETSDCPPLCDETLSLPKIRHRAENQAKRIVVYTAIINGYDKLQQPEVPSDDTDYVCFSDTPIEKPGIWQVRALDYFHLNPRRMARFAKLHPHIYFPNHEWSLWIDGRVRLRLDPEELLKGPNGDLTTFWHPDRTNPFEEAEEVIALGLDSAEVVIRQMARYRDKGFPTDAPLHETNVLLRRHKSDLVMAHSRLWFAEMQAGSHRDQLSFDYAAWRVGLPIEAFGPRPLNVRTDSRFIVSRHRSSNRNAVDRANSHFVTSGTAPVVEIGSTSEVSELPPVDIVVCVHNALDDVARCLASVEHVRASGQRLIVVDDGSGAETRDWLRGHIDSLGQGDLLVRREVAGGYTVAANEGLRRSTAPFVALLNSDTIVPTVWLRKLIAALDSGPDIGISGPLSNAASYQSIPDVVSPEGGFAINPLPDGMSVDDMDRLCEKMAARIYPRVPILNGFCIVLRRAVIEHIGLLDELTFPRGYGEENDYCFRAGDAGYSAVVACDTYVFHAKSRSYTSARRDQLARAARMALRAKWSDERVRLAAQTLQEHPWLAAMRHQMKQALIEIRRNSVRQAS